MAADNFDPTESLGPEFGGINQPGTDPQSYQPFEGEPLSFPDKINFPKPDLTNYNRTTKDFQRGVDMSKEDIGNAIRNRMSAIATADKGKVTAAKIFAYDASPESNAFYDRYAAFGDETMANIGFSPFRDNDSIFNERTTGWQNFKRSMVHGFWPLFKSGFVSGPKSLMRMLEGDFGTDPAEAETYARAAAIAQDTRGGIGAFFNNTAMNFGYTAGIITEALLEEAVGLLLAIPTGGTSVAVTNANIGRNLFRAVKGADQLYDFAKNANKTLKQIDNIQQARKFFTAARSKVGRFVNPLENVTEAAYMIGKNENNLVGLARTWDGVKKTAGGFYRDVRAVNMALAEARLEGGFVQNTVYDELYREYQEEHDGQAPDSETQKMLRNHAYAAGIEAQMWNTALIYGSNKIVIPNIVGPRGGLGNFMKSKTDEFLDLQGGKILREFEEVTLKSGKKIQVPKFKDEADSFMSTLKRFKRDPLGKGLAGVGTYFRANFMEGIQENMQEVIAGATERYYMSTYDNDAVKEHLSRRALFAEEMGNQWSAQGFETFASGFVMGAFAGPLNQAMPAADIAYNKMFNKEEYQKYKDAKANTRQRVVDNLMKLTSMDNTEGQGVKRFFDSKLFNYAKQADASGPIAAGEQAKIMYDMQEQAFIDQINSAIDSKTFDHVINHLSSFKNLTPEEFQEALGFESLEEATKQQSKIDELVQKGNKIKERHEYYDKKFPDTVDVSNLDKNSDEYATAMYYKQALATAKKVGVFFDQTYDDAGGRMVSIMNKQLSELPKNVKSSDVQILFDAGAMTAEINMLKTEVETLKKSEGAEAKKDLKEKEEKLQSLQEFREAENRYNELRQAAQIMHEFTGDAEEGDKLALLAESTLEKAYKSYMRKIGKLADTHVFESKMDESFTEYVDYKTLSAERQAMAEHINFLHDPQNFLGVVQRNYAWMKNAYENRREIYEKMVADWQANIETNALLNHLADQGIYITPEALDAWRKQGKLPDKFIDHNKKIVIERGHQDYYRYLSLFMEAAELQREAEQKPSEGLQKQLDALAAEKKAEIAKLPTVEQKTPVGEITPTKGGKITIKRVTKQLEDGQYAELTLENGETLTVYKAGDALKYNNIDGNPVYAKDVKEKITSGEIYTIEKVPDPEKLAELNELFAEREKLIYEDYREQAEGTTAFMPQIISVNDDVSTLPEEVRNSLTNKLNQLKEEIPEEFEAMDLQGFMETRQAADIINEWNDKQRELEEAHRTGFVPAPKLVVDGVEVDTSEWSDDEFNAKILQYQNEIDSINTKEEMTPEDKVRISQLDNFITDIKNYMRYRSVSEVSPEMQASIEKIEYLQSLQGEVTRTEDEKNYIITGRRHARVTNSYEGLKEKPYQFNEELENQILSMWAKSKNPGDFIEKLKKMGVAGINESTEFAKLEGVITLINERMQLKSEPQHKALRQQIKDLEAELVKLENEPTTTTADFKEAQAVYQERIDAIRAQLPLTENQAEKEVLNAIKEFGYEHNRIGGNELDNLTKQYFDDYTWDPVYNAKTMNISEETFNALYGEGGLLYNLRERAKMNEIRIFSEGLVVWDSEAYSIDAEGNKTQTGVAGEIDLIFVEQNGDVKIVDIKTGKASKWNGILRGSESGKTKIENYTLQQSSYKNLLYNMTGLDAVAIGLLPIQTKMDTATGKVTSAEKPSLSNDEGIYYLEYDPKIEEIIPRRGPSQPVVQPTAETEVEVGDDTATTGVDLAQFGLQPTVQETAETEDIAEGTAVEQETPVEVPRKDRPTVVEQVDTYEKAPTLEEMEGKQVIYEGQRYILERVPRGKKAPKYKLRSRTGEDIEFFASPYSTLEESGISIPEVLPVREASKYDVLYQGEDYITINDVEYQMELSPNGNVIGLRPTNKPEQVLRNEAMLIAADVERSKYNAYEAEEAIEEEYDGLDNAVQNLDLEQQAAYDLMAGVFENMTHEVNQTIEKIYQGERLTNAEALQADLFLTDAIIRISKLYAKNPIELYGDMLDTLENLTKALYTNNPNYYEASRKEAVDTSSVQPVKQKQEKGPKQTPLKELTDQIDSANTPIEVDAALGNISILHSQKRVSDENFDLVVKHAQERKAKLETGEGIQLTKDNLKVGDELIVKKAIFTGDKEFAEQYETLVVTAIGNKVSLKKYGTNNSIAMDPNELDEYLTTEDLAEARAKRTEKLDAEDKGVVREDISAYETYLNDLLKIETAEKEALDSTYQDLKDNLLDDLEC